MFNVHSICYFDPKGVIANK